MNVLRLELKNFRNYKDEVITFGEKTNIIYGDNAQGKTNALEALYIFALGKSFRTTQDRELIKFDEQFTKIALTYRDAFRENNIEVTILKDKKKQIKVNGVVIRKLAELIGKLNVVLFSPGELNLIIGGPHMRRRFIDIAISQLRPNYYHLLDRYAKCLEQRNNLLRKIKYENFSEDTLFIWNEKLAEYGSEIIRYRIKYINQLAEFAKEIHSDICQDMLNISYTPRYQTKEELIKRLTSDNRREIEQGFTLYGPHRDDISITINDCDAKTYGSQGQKRTAVLALKLAQAELIFNETGERPIILLDDIMSELDVKRRTYLTEKNSTSQVIITCTDAEILKNYKQAKKIHVSKGKVI